MTSVIHRQAVTPGRGFDFVVSDGSRDRYGTRINPNGWDLTAFRRNPIALFGHDARFPIGRWDNVRVDDQERLVATLVPADPGTSDRIDELLSLIAQDILRATSVGFVVLREGSADSEYDYDEQELLEISVVSIPANSNALALARSLRISPETLSLAFGEHAGSRRRDMSPGKHAVTTPVPSTLAPATLARRATTMTTLSQRIEAAQTHLVAMRDRLVDLNAADDLDLDAIETLNGEIETADRALAAMKASEAKIGLTRAGSPSAPAIARRPLGVAQREVKGLDLLVRAAVVRGISHFGRMSVEQVLNERYPGHEATAIMIRADQTIGQTTVSGWASEIVQTAYADFLQALMPYSVYPALRDRGIGLSFDGVGTVSIPSRVAGGAGGGFVGEGQPIRVGRITTAATTMTPRKMGVIVPFSRELAKRSTPAIEALVRQAILEDTGLVLDAALLDAAAGNAVRPAGLLNGIPAVASGYGGGDYQAVVADLKALLAPFYAANAGDGITVLMNPAQGLALSMMPGPGAAGEFGWAEPLTRRLNIVESTNVPAGRLIAIRNSDFATALGDAPEFDISEQATVHMEDAAPQELVNAAGAVADPTRSFFQTATIGVRMLMDVSWKMRRAGMVQWIDGTSW